MYFLVLINALKMFKQVLQEFRQEDIIIKFFCLYVALIPITKAPLLGIFGQKIQYSDIIFLIIIALFFKRWLNAEIKFSRSFSIKLLIVFLLALSFSLLNSENKVSSLIELSGIIYLSLVFFLTLNIINSSLRFALILKIWAAVGICICLMGLSGWIISLLGRNNIFIEYIPNLSLVIFPRIKAAFFTPNMFASYLHVTLILILSLWITEENIKTKRLYFYATILILFTSFLTFSRIILGILISLFMILIKVNNIPKLWLAKLLFGFFLSLVFIYVFMITVWIKPPKLALLTNKQPHSIYFLLDKAAVNMFEKHPFFGVGMGMYNKNLAAYLNWQEAEVSYRAKGISDIRTEFDPHSTFFGWSAETGIVGLLGILLFFGLYFLALLKKIKTSSISGCKDYKVYWCFLAGFLGFLVNGLYLDIMTLRHFWIMLALGLAV